MAKNCFNRRIYGTIAERVTDNSHDRAWLCNQLAKLYKEIDDGCVDNLRADKALADGGKTDNYIRAMYAGCCGTADKLVVNPKTNNSFWIGFNYGH